MKAIATIAGFTALVIFALVVVLDLTGIRLARQAPPLPHPVALIALLFSSFIFAAANALFQVAALGLLRLLPWRGPALKVERDDRLVQVFE